MSLKSRREYFRVLKERYQKEVSKKQRSLIVNEACLNTGLHRKSVLRALCRALCETVQESRSGRPRKFSEETIQILQRLYRESEYQKKERKGARLLTRRKAPGRFIESIPVLK
jgi:hypothetical protein